MVSSGILLLQKEVGERDDIVGPLAQGRHRDPYLVQAVVKVGAEPAQPHFAFQVGVGGGDDPDIDRNLASPAQTVVRATVQHTQQFALAL